MTRVQSGRSLPREYRDALIPSSRYSPASSASTRAAQLLPAFSWSSTLVQSSREPGANLLTRAYSSARFPLVRAVQCSCGVGYG